MRKALLRASETASFLAFSIAVPDELLEPHYLHTLAWVIAYTVTHIFMEGAVFKHHLNHSCHPHSKLSSLYLLYKIWCNINNLRAPTIEAKDAVGKFYCFPRLTTG